MAKAHEYHQSNKSGFFAKNHYIVTRDKTVYLRLVGDDSEYVLMTATAGEDSRNFTACRDKKRLVSVAWQFSLSGGFNPKSCQDRSGREFIEKLDFNLYQISDQSGLFDKFDQFIKEFFEAYDKFDVNNVSWQNDMQDIYRSLAPDDSGGDVYLNDGVWLASDGSLHDRGR